MLTQDQIDILLGGVIKVGFICCFALSMILRSVPVAY